MQRAGMPREITVVRCHAFGEPEAVLRVQREPCPEPGPGQVLVRMLAAPVNPADVNVIQGRYGTLPALPACCGNEGAGEVVALGSGVSGPEPGRLVRPVPGVGTWREALVAAPRQLTPLPSGLTPEQAAMLCVNPATAWRMLHDFVELRPGQWVLQNAATSAVGRHVIQLCRHLSLRSLSVVRRAEAAGELLALGADRVITEEQSGPRAIRELCGGEPLHLALNGVGGRSAVNLSLALDAGGTLVTYGAMGLEPMRLPSGPLIFNELHLAGFWVTAWYRRAGEDEVQVMLERLADLFRQGVLSTEVERRYPLQQVVQAVAHARRGGRRGKILLEMG